MLDGELASIEARWSSRPPSWGSQTTRGCRSGQMESWLHCRQYHGLCIKPHVLSGYFGKLRIARANQLFSPGVCSNFCSHCFKKYLDRYRVKVILNEYLGQACTLFIMTAVILRIAREVEIHFFMPGTAYA